MVGAFSPSLLRELASLFHPKYSVFSAFVARSDSYPLIHWWSLWPLDCPKVLPASRFFQSYMKDCFAIASNVSARDEEFYNELLPFPPAGLRVYPYLLIFCEEERIQIYLIE